VTTVVGAHEKKRLWISGVPTHSFWFFRFMEGLKRWVGEVIKKDELITIKVLHVVEMLLERDWQSAKNDKEQKRVSEMGVIFIVGFCSGVRGEELIIVNLVDTAASFKELAHLVMLHFKLFIVGRLKGHGSEKKMSIPVVGITEGTGMQPGKWIQRLLGVL
jgi:hypothetical protein